MTAAITMMVPAAKDMFTAQTIGDTTIPVGKNGNITGKTIRNGRWWRNISTTRPK